MAEFPKFEDWKAPWEESGEDFDEKRAKGLIYSRSKDKHIADEQLTAVKAERDTYKAKVDEAERKDETEVQRLQRELKERDEKLAQSANDTTSIEVLRLRVALKKGLTEVQAKRLVGKTEDELEADADDLVRSFGGSGRSDSDDDDDSDDQPSVRRQPRRQQHGLDRKDGPAKITPEEFAKLYGRQ